MTESVDLFRMEKFVVDVLEHHYSGETSRSSLSSSLSGSNAQRICSPNRTEDREREDGYSTRRVGATYLICLTIGTGGLQVVWTAIMSQGSPYLSSLGLPPSLISLVWLAGPLSGAFVQPYIGIMSDRCQHPWGRRKPFIIFGTVATIICMLALPWTADVNAFLFSSFGGEVEGRAAVVVRGLVAAAWIWALNISIQPVQAGIRALIVDSCPAKQQVQASAYASCITGIGSIFGYSSGFIPLPQVLPWFGNTQFKGLCVIASVALGSCVAITCSIVQERKVVWQAHELREEHGIAVFRQIFKRLKRIPRAIRRVCMVQFFAWMGWFPFLFYITTYIGDLYQAEIRSHPDATAPFQSPMTLQQFSVRYGSFCMVLFATTALLTNLLLPLFVSSSEPRSPTSTISPPTDTPQSEDEPSSPDFPSGENERSPFLPPASPPSPQPTSKLAIPWLTLSRSWAASHILSSLLLFSTALTHARIPSTILVALLGIPWALTQWAPFALISSEIAKGSLGHPGTTSSDEIDEDEDEYERVEEQAGTILGLLNMAIAVPQIVAAVGSSALFWLLGRWGIVGGEAVGWVLRMGGVTMGVATVLAYRLGT